MNETVSLNGSGTDALFYTKTSINTSDRESYPYLSVIGSSVCYENDSFDFSNTEVRIMKHHPLVWSIQALSEQPEGRRLTWVRENSRKFEEARVCSVDSRKFREANICSGDSRKFGEAHICSKDSRNDNEVKCSFNIVRYQRSNSGSQSVSLPY
uniref:Uncharacterized protein n=1 Tax=Timema poppense TaxID=170557 RepID=A0A7R9CRQ8_TIMPO|nr:unnamed protein product [Timema poppensis]